MANPNSTTTQTFTRPANAQKRLVAAPDAIRHGSGTTTDAATVPTIPVDDGAASALPAPYHCPACGATSPYQGRRTRAKGGSACRECAAIEREINAARQTVYNAIASAAYQNGCHGAEKQAILSRAVAESSHAWRQAQIAFGVALDRADVAGMAAALTDAASGLLAVAQDLEVGQERVA